MAGVGLAQLIQINAARKGKAHENKYKWARVSKCDRSATRRSSWSVRRAGADSILLNRVKRRLAGRSSKPWRIAMIRNPNPRPDKGRPNKQTRAPATNPEIVRFFEEQRKLLPVVKTTRTPSGQILDWIPMNPSTRKGG